MRVSKILTGLIIVCLLPVCQVSAQQTELPLNQAGIMAGIEWNTISGLAGLSYERTIYTRDNLQAGARVLYILPYETGNFKLLGNDCCEEIQSTSVWATGYYFTAATGKPRRFYLQSALGAGLKKYQVDGNAHQSIYPGFEAGLGLYFPVSKKLFLRWHNSIIFLHNNGGTTATQLHLVF